jgi:hypothetical protein
VATTDPENNLRDLFASLEQAKTQADHADEQEAEDRRNALRDRVCSIRELVWKETEQADSLLGPLVRRGMTTVIGGYGGAGKSTMSLDMIRAIVTGDDFLGWDGKGDCTAFIIDLEQGLSVAQRRVYEAFTGKPAVGVDLQEQMKLIKMSDNEWENVLYADWQEGVDLSNPGPDLDVVREFIESCKPDVVMIDPIYKLFMGSDLNEQVVISAFVREIQKLRNEHGFALILPMHPRKQGMNPTGLTMHDLYGAAIWSWWAEQIVMIHRPRETDGSRLTWEKDRLSESPIPGSKWNLEFEPGRGFRRVAGDAPDKGDRWTDQIWQWLQKPEQRGKFFSTGQIKDALGIPKSSAERAFPSLARKKDMGLMDGLIIRKDGRWHMYAYRPDNPTLMPMPDPPDADDDWNDYD